MSATDPVITLLEDLFAEVRNLTAKVEQLEARDADYTTVDGLASRYAMSVDWVYNNAERLGGTKTGESDNAPWRFRVTRSDELFDKLGKNPSPAGRPRGRPRSTAGSTYPKRLRRAA